MLVLEDVHWADEATLDLLRYLGRRVEQRPAAGGGDLPRRRGRRRPSARQGAGRPRHRGRRTTPARAAAEPWTPCAGWPRTSARPRRGRAARAHGRQRLLRHRGARRAGEASAAGDRPGRRARAHGSPALTRDGAGRAGSGGGAGPARRPGAADPRLGRGRRRGRRVRGRRACWSATATTWGFRHELARLERRGDALAQRSGRACTRRRWPLWRGAARPTIHRLVVHAERCGDAAAVRRHAAPAAVRSGPSGSAPRGRRALPARRCATTRRRTRSGPRCARRCPTSATSPTSCRRPSAPATRRWSSPRTPATSVTPSAGSRASAGTSAGVRRRGRGCDRAVQHPGGGRRGAGAGDGLQQPGPAAHAGLRHRREPWSGAPGRSRSPAGSATPRPRSTHSTTWARPSRSAGDYLQGVTLLERSRDLALAADAHEHVARAYTNLGPRRR